MKKTDLSSSFNLKSGKTCRLLKIRKHLIPNYYLLAFPKQQGEPTVIEVYEMLQIGIDAAQKIALKLLDDKEAYTILYSGYSARREKGWHVHIILLGNRWRKAWLYLILASKNLLQALRLRKDDTPNKMN